MFGKITNHGVKDKSLIWTRVCTAVSHPILLFLLLTLPLPLQSISSRTIQEVAWSVQKSGVFSRLSSVFFVDRRRGWVVGSNGTLLVTEDGGEKWRRIALPERQKREMVRDIWRLNAESGAERLCLLGEYGTFSARGTYNITDRAFVLVGSEREENWTESMMARQPYRRPDKILGKISVDDEGKIRVKDPDLYEETLRTPEPVMVRMFFVNDREGWSCGESGAIQMTTDGGVTWKLQQALTRKLLYDVMAVDNMQAWIVGAAGTVLRTVDGGKMWEEVASGIPEALRAVYFLDAKRGWAAGANGRIITTVNGGKTWLAQKSNTTQTLNDIFFVTANEGWAAGDQGTLLHTLDGGVIWQELLLNTHANMTKLFFVAPNCGWVVGTNGVILKYN